MADKLILNADLNYKAVDYTPEKCVVEKVIDVYNTEFKSLIEKPMKNNYYLSRFKELMGFCDEAYHCVLFVNKDSGDGLLVNSEGADYARYSQFIPNASGIIAAHEQTAALSELEKSLGNWIRDCIWESSSKQDFCVRAEDFLKDKHTQELFKEWVCQEMQKYPVIGCLEKNNNTIVAFKNELTDLKLYCPLKILSEPDDYETDCCEEYPGNYIGYVSKINAKIREDIMSDEDMQTRGLIAYTDNNHLYRKVHSVFPQVESRNGNLYGVITVKSYGELDKSELIDLTNEISGQLSDGWGEGFEQREIRLGDDKVYISFWNCDDDYFLKPESEVFPEQGLNQGMGGIN